MRTACLLMLLLPAVASAGVGSTADEWADRFAPEPGKAPDVPVYADAYEKAVANIDAGRPRAALGELFDSPDAARANLLRARALIALGEHDDALALLAAPPLATNADALRLRIETLLEAGRFNDALPLADVVAKSDAPFGKLLLGQTLEAAGRFKDAIAAYHWYQEPPRDAIVRWANQSESFDDAAVLTDTATAVHRWATLTLAYKDAPKLNDTVLAMYTRAFDVIDRGYWPARIAAARFALARGDRGKFESIVAPLAKRSPGLRALLLVQGEAAKASGSENAMHGIAGVLRKFEPDSADAALLEMTTLARARSADAIERAVELRKPWPMRLDLAGAFAGLAFLAGDEATSTRTLAEADKVAPQRADALVTAAEILNEATQRKPAVALLNTAIARTPWETTPLHVLGDIYVNDGYDDAARKVLDQAYALDPYHVETLNYFRLLDELAKYQQTTTEHFILYADKDADPIAAQQIGDYLEGVYADVCGVFDYHPAEKCVVQIYPEDDAFSVRMAGVPGVENYGVSFGRVLAAIAPRKGTSQGNFNFARVLRHEFVHTINLMQTNQRCPRWLTEGLAVWQEHVPFRFADVPAELYRRTFADELFTVRTFPLAYIRPKRDGDGEQAYTQGAYLAMYLDETFGTPSIVKLLNAYGRSKTDEEAFQLATGRPMAEVESGWHAWMKAKLKPWNYDAASIKKGEALAEEGAAQIKVGDLPEALKTWQQACDLQPTEVAPHRKLAGIYLSKAINDPAKAIEHLKFLHVLELSDARFASNIAKLYDRLGDTANAAKWAREATFVDLYDPTTHEFLAAMLDKTGDTAGAEKERAAVEQLKLWQERRKIPSPGSPGEG